MSSTVESTANRKVPLEELSKEELVKKCKNVILLAQKAKQVKDEVSEENQALQNQIKELQAGLNASEENFTKVSKQNANFQEQLQATQELLTTQQKLQTETEAAVERRVSALNESVRTENAELLKELNGMNQVLKQRGELISKMTANHTEYKRQIDELEDNLSQTAKELAEKNQQIENFQDYTRQLDELKATLRIVNKELFEKNAKMESMNSQHNLFRDNMQKMEKKLSEKVSEVENLTQKYETQIADLRNQLKDSEQFKVDANNFLAQLQERESEVKILNEGLESAEKKLSSNTVEAEKVCTLEKNLSELQSQLIIRQEEMEKLLNLEKEKLEAYTQEREKRIFELEKENEEIKINLQHAEESMKSCVKSSDDEIVNFKRNIKELEQSLKLKEEEINQLQSMELENQELKSLVHSLQEDEVQGLRLELNAKSDNIANLQELLKNLEEQSKLNEEKLLEKCEEAESISKENQQLNLQLSVLNDELKSLQCKLETTEEKLSSLRNEALETKSEEDSKLLSEIEKLIGLIKEKDVELENCRSQLMEKDECLQNAQEVVQQQTSTIENLNFTIEEQKSQLEEIQNCLKDNSKNEIIIDLKSQISKLETELAQNQEEASIKKKEIINLENHCSDLKEKLDVALADVQKGTTCVEKLQSEIETFKSELSICEVKINDLNLKAESERKLLAEKDKVLKSYTSKEEAANLKEVELNAKLETAQKHLTSAIEEEANRKKELTELIETLRAKDDECRQLNQQLLAAQESVQKKEAVISDLEQELAKIRDGGATEMTNTEISSTFSMSRAEEQTRLRDLEDSFEDKYTKLRVVAVKLKKRVSELNQTLDGERNKMAAERAELQLKINQLTSHAKTVQTLQAEVDRLQDALDEQKKIYNQLNKDLEMSIHESTDTKVQLTTLQESYDKVVREKNSLEAQVLSVETTVSQAEEAKTKMEKLRKDLSDRDAQIERVMEEKKKILEELEKTRADAKKKGVLSLEIADMEKSVTELTQQLSSEKTRSKKLEEELNQERNSLSDIRDQLVKEENILLEEKKINSELKDTMSVLKKDINSKDEELEKQRKEIEKLSIMLEEEHANSEKLTLQCSDLGAKNVRDSETARHQIVALSRQVFQLEEQCALMRDSNRATEDELNSVRSEFESYRVRAQSVLRKSGRTEDRSAASTAVHDVEELELEVERLRVSVETLKTNLHTVTTQLQAALQEAHAEKEEKTHLSKLCQTLRESSAQAAERQHAAEERLVATTDEARQAKLHSDTLIQCYKQQLEELKATHQKKINALNEQLEKLQATVERESSMPVEGIASASASSPVAEWAATTTGLPHSDLDGHRMPSLQREEGEGSESVDSFPSRRISVTTQERRHELIPLDKLLSSSTYPEDEVLLERPCSVDIERLQGKLTACEARVVHLTALLSEAESDAARLSELNTVLKEEIRRLQRSEERTQHAHNLEYLKNVVVKFSTLQSGDERQRLVPVLNTILKLSPEETGALAAVAKGTVQPNTNTRSWGSYLPLQGWSGT